jgi:cytochrome c oxidase cbb3-type subunit 4
MRAMYEEFYRTSALLHLPIAALMLFIAIFSGVILYVWISRGGAARYSTLASLPLDGDGENHD